jgi:uncharacterized protein
MSFLDYFSLPYAGMKDGVHGFDFSVGRDFFRKFDDLPVVNGDINVHLDVDKRAQHSILEFDITGTVATLCDRCLADINLPIRGKQTLHVKVGIGEDDGEVVFISEDTVRMNVAQYIYEFICLVMPAIRVYDCASESTPPCDIAVLEKLEVHESDENDIPSGQLADIFKNGGIS